MQEARRTGHFMEVHMRQRFQASTTYWSLRRSPAPATSLAWLGGCVLLLWAAQASAGDVSLAWDPVSAPNLAGYRLYYSQTPSSYTTYIDAGLSTTATVPGLTAGQTYYFVVTAYDTAGEESGASNTVTVTLTPDLPDEPTLALSVNTPSFQTGNTLTLTAISTPGPTPVSADVYIALQPPECTSLDCALFWQGGEHFTTTPTPILSNWHVSPFNAPIFHYTFGGTEPVGSYVWVAAFTAPGTGNFIGGMTQVPFTFAP